jgi:exodeoxyribonuclease VII small subunit
MNSGASSYEARAEQLERILSRLDDSATPIDELAQDVKQGALLIRQLDEKLREVESQVLDAFRELEASAAAAEAAADKP